MIPFVVAAVAVFVVSHVAPFPFLLDAVSGRRSVWGGPRTGRPPTVYLTFDDGPNPKATARVLDALREHGVRATFFLIDTHVTDATAPLVRRMREEGHGVAVHTANRWLLLKSPSSLEAAVQGAADTIEQRTGVRPCRLFRPHAGWRSHMMMTGLGRAEYRLVGWSWFAWDWNWGRRRTAESVAARLEKRARDGLIAVVHDGHHQQTAPDRDYAIGALGRALPALRARGFAFGNLCAALDAS
jgi:peptidoglycan/xylan/chitin deacetylase (PgdA/CDA1 family)